MPNVIKLAIAASLLVVGVIGITLLPGLGRVTGPTGSSSPASSASPAPSSDPCAHLSDVDAIAACRVFGPERPLTDKRGSVLVDGVAFSFELSEEGWEQFGDISLNKSLERGQAAEALIYWTALPGGAIAHQCWFALGMPIGPSAADAVAAVATAQGIEVVAGPSDVEIGGRPATYLETIVREDRGCDPGYFHLWDYPYVGALWRGPGVGATIRVWIVEVDGVRLFIAGETVAHVDPAGGQEILSIVNSIRFK